MTAVVGYGDGATAWLGVDSRASESDGAVMGDRHKHLTRRQIDRRHGTKQGDLLIATAGASRVAMEIRHHWTPPLWFPAEDPEAFLATVAASLSKHFTKHDGLWQLVKHEEEGILDGAMALAWTGAVYYVGGDFCVHRPADDLIAVGSGGQLALGALAAFHGSGHRGPELLEKALTVTSWYRGDVAPPFDIQGVSA